MTFDERVTALRPYTRTGPNYLRPVADNLRTAVRLHHDGRDREAEYWLTEAETALRRYTTVPA
jgi:hypothetical protein